jgi:two-component system chemotaxis response regulator CheB
MGEDGTKGLRELKQHQARVLVQDEATSVVWGMPGSAVRAGCADEILPLGKIARRISELC